MLKKYLLFLLVLITTPVFAQLEMQVDRDNLASDEMLTMVISSHDRISFTPDLAPLKKDFHVVGTSQNSQFSIINGSAKMETQWQIVLLPKHDGDIVLPSIQVGNEKTNERLIHVSAIKTNASVKQTKSENFFIEASVSPKESYIQEQVVYTLKLFYNRSIENPMLMAPDLIDAKISQNGQDILYTTIKNGRYYRVLERSYVLKPKNEGRFQIQPPILKGYVEESSRAISIYGLSNSTLQPIKVMGPTLSILVKPKPTNFNGPWLPAKKLLLTDEWETKPVHFREGEPVTRIIKVAVQGASGEQIPLPVLTTTPNVNFYPQQPIRESMVSGEMQQGSLTQKIVYIPTASGKINLPEIKMRWWDSASKKEQVAVIPSQSFKVLPAANHAPSNVTPAPSQKLALRGNDKPATIRNSAPMPSEKNLFWPIIAILFILIWLTTLFLWRRQTKHMTRFGGKKDINEQQGQLREACFANNAKQVRKLFLGWASAYWHNPNLHTLSDVIQILNQEKAATFEAQIMQLEAVFYSKNKTNWVGSFFWEALQDYLKVKQSKADISKQDPLPPLYFSS